MDGTLPPFQLLFTLLLVQCSSLLYAIAWFNTLTTFTVILTVKQSHALETLCLVLIGAIVLMRLGRDGFTLSIYLRPSRQRTNRILELFSWIVLTVGVLDEWLGASPQGRAVVGAQLHPYARWVLLACSLRGMQRELDVMIDMVPVRWFVFVDCFSLLFTLLCYYGSYLRGLQNVRIMKRVSPHWNFFH